MGLVIGRRTRLSFAMSIQSNRLNTHTKELMMGTKIGDDNGLFLTPGRELTKKESTRLGKLADAYRKSPNKNFQAMRDYLLTLAGADEIQVAKAMYVGSKA